MTIRILDNIPQETRVGFRFIRWWSVFLLVSFLSFYFVLFITCEQGREMA